MVAKKVAGKKAKPIAVAIVPTDEAVSERIYSNYVDVIHSPYDMTIRFSDVGPVRDFKAVAENQGIHGAPVVAEIAIPNQLVPGLIKALQVQHKQYVKNYEGGANGKKRKSK